MEWFLGNAAVQSGSTTIVLYRPESNRVYVSNQSDAVSANRHKKRPA